MTFQNDGATLRNLHARLADAVDGYRDGIDHTTNEAVAEYFEAYRAMHTEHMTELDRLMLSADLVPNQDGTWHKLSHNGIMAFGASVDRLDARITGAVTRGERMLADLYEEALDSVKGNRAAEIVLARQMAELDGPFGCTGMARQAA